MQLNGFQRSTQRKLNDLFDRFGRAGRFEIEGGPNEFAVVARVGEHEFWIYPDGAGVWGGGIDKPFEIYDFNSLRHLQHDYIQFVEKLLAA